VPTYCAAICLDLCNLKLNVKANLSQLVTLFQLSTILNLRSTSQSSPSLALFFLHLSLTLLSFPLSLSPSCHKVVP